MTFNEVKQIADTLPIGYYLKRRISASLGEKEPMSCYNPMEDTIIVSYPQVSDILKKMPTKTETAIRSCLYHEVSHAILTPKRLLYFCVNEKDRKIMNIFEDERIESLLNNYYLDADFDNCKYAINGYTKGEPLPPPRNDIEAFYYAVRFRDTTDAINKEIDTLIGKYRDLTSSLTDIYWVSSYLHDVRELFDKICKETKTKKSPSADEKSIDPTMGKDGKGKKEKDKESKSGEGKSGEAEKEIPAKGRAVKTLTSEEIVTIFNGIVNATHNQSFSKTVEAIFQNFHKKNKGGSGLMAHSGVLNPRLCGREDYRFFERSTSLHGSNTFGSFHLNLFIDVSGSFCRSEQIVNAMLASLHDIENKNSNFSFDLVTINTRVTKEPKKQIKCNGGNRIPNYTKDIVRSLQLPNTYNYNIVLFDGNAFSDSPMGEERNMGFFDMNNCTIITDTDNEKYCEKFVHSAKVVVVTEEYAKELQKHIENAIAKAFG